MEISSKSTFKEALAWASIFLRTHQFPAEHSRMYLLWLMDWTLTDYVNNKDQTLGQQTCLYLQDGFARIVQDEPIQYIVGYQDFNGRRFQVSPATLIPREETTGILTLARSFLLKHPQARVLDIGTGTGVLAINLKLDYPEIDMVASDISAAALEIARLNGQSYQVDVHWCLSDLFSNLAEESFDLIVSNPPYIGQDELYLMDQSVIKYEPKVALFADYHGLVIYQDLAQVASQHLKPGGQMILEMGYQQAQALKQIFHKHSDYRQISIHQDFNGLDRFITIES
ncbi:release factor glutamine methyltransferase [Ignavigranum ruoffiae]|uniref:peptide chain release factor N(5)-glutamine methyltransferase n=1 Tax=Ignavigranum ruoffiae TaxID=89093 RepID=A0A1H9E1W7_9LACT|nr:peptide chain release factor N(5)-glutamine methyltransferase [Ignavigranum ruoffiae]SEQ19592.1 release factor glutamine methyltransferase [Ignavigranum ruoffiae]